MRNLQVVELNSTLEMLNEHELYSFKGGLEGGQSDVHEIPEVIIPAPGGDDGGGDDGYDDGGDPPTWDDNDPSPGDDGDDPFPSGGGEDPGNDDDTSDPEQHNLPQPVPQICTQLGSTGECTMKALDVISKFFGGDAMGIHKDDFAQFVGLNNPGEAAMEFLINPNGGLTMDELNGLVDEFFTNTDLGGDTASIISHLDNGHPILATIIDPATNTGHAVVIIGFNAGTNMVTIANSLAPGGVETIAYNASTMVNQSAISGFQNNATVNQYRNDSNDWWIGCGMSASGEVIG
ncbi:C39 family peptidase [Chryseobacterium flavum]|nr:C39 family peptidase [Chryseobacterium flavum]